MVHVRTKAKIACSHICKLDVTPHTYCCHTNIYKLLYLIQGAFVQFSCCIFINSLYLLVHQGIQRADDNTNS